MSNLVGRGVGIALLVGWFVTVSGAETRALQFTNTMRLSDGLLQVQLMTEVGNSYTLEISTNLVDWMPVVTFMDVETNLLTLIDPEPVVASRARFYRARLGVEALFEFSFHHYVQGGNFGAGTTATPVFPVLIDGYTANMYVSGERDYLEPSEVYFTGPQGSGLLHELADPENSWIELEEAAYQSPFVASPSTGMAGDWVVNYGGAQQNFEVVDPQAAARLVLPVPTVQLSEVAVESVAWTYRSPSTGEVLSGPPAHMMDIQLQIEGLTGGRIYDSEELAPSVTQHHLSSFVAWTNVVSVAMAYDDNLGNHYVVFFQKP